MNIWTEERVEQLKALHAKGLSASQIAAQLEVASRSAVLGKLSRLGFGIASRREKLRLESDWLSRGQGGRPLVPAEGEAKAEHLDFGTIAYAPPKFGFTPAVAAVMALGPGTCRWPMGEPGEEGFHFCGEKAGPGRSYCAFHRGQADGRNETQTESEGA